MVLTEAKVKNCMKNPLMAQPVELYGIFPVIREDKNSGPGTRAFIKSVVAKAAMNKLVVVLRRGFLNTTVMTIALPTNDRIRSKMHINDSRTTSSLRLKGIWFVISLKNFKRTRINCREVMFSATTCFRFTSLQIVRGYLLLCK